MFVAVHFNSWVTTAIKGSSCFILANRVSTLAPTILSKNSKAQLELFHSRFPFKTQADGVAPGGPEKPPPIPAFAGTSRRRFTRGGWAPRGGGAHPHQKSICQTPAAQYENPKGVAAPRPAPRSTEKIARPSTLPPPCRNPPYNGRSWQICAEIILIN